MNQNSRHFLSYLTHKQDGGLNVHAVAETNGDVRNAIETSNRDVHRYFSSQNIIKGVIANRDDICKAIADMGRHYFDYPQHVEFVMEHAEFDISRRFANFCSLFRSFLDHFDRHFLKSHGRGSVEYNRWKSALSKEYDESVAYKIVCGVRNYIQHYDLPPLHLSISNDVLEEGTSMRIDVGISVLMKDPEFSRKLRCHLDSSVDRLPLIKIIDEWSACFQRIVDIANRQRLKYVVTAAQHILSLRRDFSIPEEGRIALIALPEFESDAKPDKLNLRINWIDEAKASQIISEKDDKIYKKIIK